MGTKEIYKIMDMKDVFVIILDIVIIFGVPLIPAYFVWKGIQIDQDSRWIISIVVYIGFIAFKSMLMKEYLLFNSQYRK